ncbi:MAG TPA: copper resistance protein CopC [Chloroflexota bacterium]|nr:copper resistance protein CopC [Chloroflexota bacterium]
MRIFPVLTRARGVRLCAVALAVLLGLLTTGTAQAHALYEHSSPGSGVVLREAPSQVVIWFSEDLSPASKIVVWNRARQDEASGASTIVPGNSKALSVPLKTLAAGSYLVLWTSVSADDGHILHGFFVFSVKHRGPLPSLSGVSLGSGQQSFPDAPTLAALVAHWLELLAAVTWVGTLAFAYFVVQPMASSIDEAHRRREHALRYRLAAASLVLLLVASSALILLEAYGLAGNSWSGVLHASTWQNVFAVDYGRLWAARQALALLALGSLLPLLRWPVVEPLPSPSPGQPPPSTFLGVIPATRPALGARRGPDVPVLALLAGLLYLYLFAASGHAASAAIGTVAGGHLLSISVAADWLHFVADALWFGGQIYLVVALIPALRFRHSVFPLREFLDALSRFSQLAYLSVGLYVVSGAFAAKVHIPSWYAYFNSIYGRALILKMGLIGLMMLTSVLTVFVLRPALRRAAEGHIEEGAADLVPRVARLLFWLRLNPVLGVGVLLATSVMFYYPVPIGFGPPPASSYSVSGGGLTGLVRVQPGRAGPNTISISLRDAHGRPVTQAGVRVLTNMLDMVMGQGIGVLNPTRTPGTFAGSTELGMGGNWNLRFLIYLPNGTSYLQMTVNIRVAS